MLFNALGEFALNQALAKRLTTPGPAPSPTVEPAIFPALVLENDRPEWGWLKGEIPASGRSSQIAVAGQFSCASLLNPVNSKLLIVVEAFEFNAGGSAGVFKITQQALAGTPVTVGSRDSRVPGLRVAGQMSIGTVGGLAPEAPLGWTVSGGAGVFTSPIVLAPGWSFRWELATVNIAMNNAGIYWRERPAQPGEL